MTSIHMQNRLITRALGLVFSLTLCTACNSALKSETESFPAAQVDFAAYRDAVKAHITPRSLNNRTAQAIELNLPFELSADKSVPYRGKFLLFHGLNDSTYIWSDTAQALQAKGFDVRAILLPGHGSHPREMLDVTYNEWLTTAREHFNIWNSDTTPIYLGGFSLGAVIATVLALEQQSVAGLLLFSPAFHSQLNHLLRWSWAYKRIRPWMFGGVILEDNPIKYNSIPINSGDQYYRTTRYLKRNWRNQQLDIPMLAVMSSNDSVVNIDSVRNDLARRFTNPRNRILVYSNDTPPRKFPREEFKPSQYLNLRILNQSPLSVLTAPSNPLFGESGSVLVCNGNEYKIFFACMGAKGHWFGAQHTPSPDGVAVARTTYNPDWDYVLTQFDQVFGIDSY